MSKYNRKQRTPKEDEFVSFWTKLYKLAEPYMRAIGISAASALAIVAAVWGFMTMREHKAQAAAEEFGRAVRIYDADLLTDSTPPKTDEESPTPRFKTEKERADAALGALDQLDKDFGGSKVAKQGQVLRAGILYDQGRYEESAKLYQSYLQSGSHDPAVTAIAREGAGLCAEAQTKLDDALTQYKALEPSEGDFYRDRALFAQARIYTKKGDKKKAIELYNQVLTKLPMTPLKDEIQAHLAGLEGT